jgi:hypothetical protein
VSPPKRLRVVVVNDPRAETLWSVSRPTVLVKLQNCPFERQIPCPATVAVAKLAIFAWRVEAVALPAVRVPVTVEEAARRLVPVAEVKERLVTVPDALMREAMEALVAERLVVVTEVPVAFVKLMPWALVSPVTFNVPATLSVPVTLEEAATNPPKNWAVVVVKLPRAVTDWRVSFSTVPAGQPTPFARHTA